MESNESIVVQAERILSQNLLKYKVNKTASLLNKKKILEERIAELEQDIKNVENETIIPEGAYIN
jgi:hypothetical protein